MTEGRKGSFEGGVIDYILVKNVFGTISKIGFKSCDQGREKFQGTSLDYVWFDEEPPFDIYTECKMRLLDTCGNMFGTMTPLKGLTWVYNHIYLNQNQDQEIWWQTMQWEDNPFLPKQEVENMTATMSEDELQSRKFGVFGANGGLVYSEFDPSVHVIEPFEVPREWYDTISIDPGLNNPLSAHWYAVDYDGNIFVIAEHYQAKKDIAYHANAIKSICQKLCWHTSYNGMIEALIDSAANQRTLASVKSVSELFF
jgi:phage terminase large subunit-like protein